jgi:hypothetical protein
LRRRNIAQVFALSALGIGACSLDVRIDPSHLLCADGQCPTGYSCVATVCRPDHPVDTPAACNPVTLVADDFGSGPRNPIWGAAYAQNGAATSQPRGRLRIDVPANLDGAAYAGYRTDRYYDLRGSQLEAEIGQMVSVDSHAQLILQVMSDDPGENAGFEQQHGELKLFARTRGHDDTMVVPYDGDAQRFWRLREDDGQLDFETSPDGETWKLEREVAAPFALALVRVDVAAGVYQAEDDPGAAEVLNVNGGHALGTHCPAASLVDDFADGKRDVRWAASYDTAHCDVGEQGGDFFAAPPDRGLGEGYCAYRSAAAYDLTGSQVVIAVDQMIQPASGPAGVAFLKLTTPQNGHGVELAVEGGTRLLCRRWEAGELDVLGTSAWDARADRFWKLAEADGEVSWSTSPDGSAWSTRCTTPTSHVHVSDVQIELGAGVTMPLMGGPIGIFKVSGVNPR